MASRKEVLATGEYYHIYNRGAGKQDIFEDPLDSWRFLMAMQAFNTDEPFDFFRDFRREGSQKNVGGPTSHIGGDPQVEFIAYCLLPNHFHMVVKQLEDGGITKFMRKLGSGYVGYYNRRHKRVGTLFSGAFRAKHIVNESILQYVTAYVLANDTVHKIPNDNKLVRSAWREYFDEKYTVKLCNKFILSEFKNSREFESYVKKTATNIAERRKREKKVEGIIE